MFVHNTFSPVWVAEWPPFGKGLPTWLAACSHCILSICNFRYFPFRFSGLGLVFDCSSSLLLFSRRDNCNMSVYALLATPISVLRMGYWFHCLCDSRL